MPTTFNWIYLGVPRAPITNLPIVMDPVEGGQISEGAGLLVGSSFGSSQSPLYNQVVSGTMQDQGGAAGALDTNNLSSNDTFQTNIGAGNQTFTYDGLTAYNTTITYADGTTANTTIVAAQSTSGELFLAPPPTGGTANPLLTSKPIQSLTFTGVNTADGNFAADRLQVGWDNGFVDGTAAGDVIDNTYVEPVGAGSDVIDGGDGISSTGTAWQDDRVRAGAGNDTILSGLGNDSVLGEGGNDNIDGGAGSDTIDGGDGNDTINLTSTYGADSITGGIGSDTINAGTQAGATTVTFTNGTGSIAGAGGTATFNTVEGITTGAGNDVINAAGNSTLGATYSTGAGVDNITGGAAAETILAGSGNDIIDAGAGADAIDAGDGDDTINLTGTYGADAITGGVGNDTINAGTQGASTVTFTNGTGSIAGAGGTATFNTVEGITTGAGNDVINAAGNSTLAATYSTGAGADNITGGAAAETILAGAGDDIINAGGGADRVEAGDGNDTVLLTTGFGNDTIIGGLGVDALDASGLGASTVSIGNGTGSIASGGSSATFDSIETLTTGSGADIIDASGNSGSPITINAGDGADVITGGGATETINAGIGNDVINGGGGADVIDAGTGDDAINLTGTYGNDTITGGAGSDVLNGTGLGGNATVTFANGGGSFANTGGTANFNTIETVNTGAGADTINASANDGAATFNTGGGADVVTGGSGAETISAGAGADVVNSGGGNDLVLGGDGGDEIDGGTGNDTLSGGVGTDTVAGGEGNDLIGGGGLVGGFFVEDNQADTLTGGTGADTFAAGNNDLISDFGATDNAATSDFVDLSGYYNEDNLAIINATRAEAGLKTYDTALGWMRADQTDDGILNSINTTNGFNSAFNLRVQNNGAAVSADDLAAGNSNVVCFAADVLIDTQDGPVAAGDLQVGQMVVTRDDGLQPLRWIGTRKLTARDLDAAPKLRPIRIRKGALGGGTPTADLVVSPQHRILVRSTIAQRMFGAAEVLVAAKQLCEIDGIDIAHDVLEVTYVHFLFDAHQIVVSNGAETESLYTGTQALGAVGEAAREEIFAIFPDLRQEAERPAARVLCSGKMARKLAERHARNGRQLVA